MLESCQHVARLLAEARILLVVAHFDDETIGCGARLHLLGQLTIVYVTDGSPTSLYDAHRLGFSDRESYAAVRRSELAAALATAEVDPELIELGIPDQDAAFYLPELIARLRQIVRDLRPDLVITHPYEGGHPDHDACAFAVRSAFQGPLLEFAGYHLLNSQLITGEFLPSANEIHTFGLPSEEQVRKRRMINCFASQRQTLAPFRTEYERFRCAPKYEFTFRPHSGPLNYERFGWRVNGDIFTKQVRKALGS